MKHGKGKHHTTTYDAEGCFLNNKLDGQATLKTWDSEYKGGFKNGKKEGLGKLIDRTKRIQYDGMFSNDLMSGAGKLLFTSSGFTYHGQFKNGQACLIPNEFEVRVGFWKSDGGQSKFDEPTATKGFEYELQGDAFSLEIRSCYQGPMQLDEVQPTQ